MQVRPRLTYGRSGLRCIVEVLRARLELMASMAAANKNLTMHSSRRRIALVVLSGRVAGAA